MIRKLLFATLGAALLAGCATGYQYRGGSGDYYYGQPSVEYQDDGYYGPYGYGYPGGWGGSLGFGYGYGGYGGPYGYPYCYPYGYGDPYFDYRYRHHHRPVIVVPDPPPDLAQTSPVANVMLHRGSCRPMNEAARPSNAVTETIRETA